MPLIAPSNQVDLLVSGTAGSLNPIVKNCFKLQLANNLNSGSGLVASISALATNSRTTLSRGTSFIVQAQLPIEVDFRPPTMRGERRQVNVQGREFKYSGWPAISDINLSSYNYLEFASYTFYYHWWCLVHNIFPDRSRTFLPSERRRLRPDEYKVDATVFHFGPDPGSRAGNSAGDMKVYTKWNLHGLYPLSVTSEALDNTDTGRPVLTHIEFSVDHCEPVTA